MGPQDRSSDADRIPAGAATPVNTPRQGTVREPDRNDDRVLRLLHLCDRRGSGVSPVVLSGLGPGLRDPRFARDVCDRLPRAADRLGALRPLRRSHRPQDDARGGASDDGHLDRRDRCASDVCEHRRRGAAAAGDLPVRAGAGPRRRVGRGSASRHRERSSGQARVVRDVPAARRAGRVLLFGHGVPGALSVAHRRTVLQFRMADSRSWPARCS